MSMTICDKCDRRKQCNNEGRLITYTTLNDNWTDHAYEKNGIKAAHGMLGMGEVCPLRCGVNIDEHDELH